MDDFLFDPPGADPSEPLPEGYLPTWDFDVADIFSDWAEALDGVTFDFIPDWSGASTGAAASTGSAGAPGFAAFMRSKLGMVTLAIVAGLIVWRLVKR